MSEKPLMREARDLIRFYDRRGWDWTSALGFILFRGLFEESARIVGEGYYANRIGRRRKAPREGA